MTPSQCKNLLQIDNLRFGYDEEMLFDGFSLAIAENTITALIGPNGAGKSTLMNCITGITRPLSGDIHISGSSVLGDPNSARQHMGYLPDNFGLYDNLTARQHLLFAAAGYQCANITDVVKTTAETAGVTALLEKYPNTMSRGQRQRLGIAMAIIHKPPLVLMDEPASGLDPIARAELSALIKNLQQNGATLIVSSHILSELREYATDYVIINNGEIEEQGTTLTPTTTWRIISADNNSHCEQVLGLLQAMATVKDPRLDDGAVWFELPDKSAAAAVLRNLITAGVAVVEFSSLAADIGNIYRQRLQKK